METYETQQEAPKRPVFLTVLCILTFVTSGFSFIGLLFNGIKGPMSANELELSQSGMQEMIDQLRSDNMDGMADMMEKISAMTAYTNEAFYTIFMLNILTFLLGLFGAILMWQGRKLGFHLYIIYNIIAILTVYAVVPVNEVPSFITILNVIISAVFIFMYSRNLHWLK